jgi:hypothetical protein
MTPRLGRAFEAELTTRRLGLAPAMDEIWLRTHRLLHRRLAASGCWAAAADWDQFLAEHRAQGRRLQTDLLRPALGDDDDLCIRSSRVWGASNARLRTQLPLVMASGFELGDCLARVLGLSPRPERCRQIASASALFGVSAWLLDAAAESKGLDALSSAFPSIDQHGLPPLDAYEAIATDEARIALKAVMRSLAAVCDLHSSSAEATPRPAVWHDMMEVYRTRAISKTAATRPFAVLAQIAEAGAGAAPEAASVLGRALALALGEIWWLTADLIGVPEAFASGASNALLQRHGIARGTNHGSDQRYDGMMALLEGPAVHETVDEIVACVERMEALLEGDDVPRDVARRWRRATSCYLRMRVS